MLDNSRIQTIVREIAAGLLDVSGLERVILEPMIDSQGGDALRITLVFKPEAVRNLTGDQTLDLLVGIQQRLESDGEQRLPIVQYATEEDLEAARLGEPNEEA